VKLKLSASSSEAVVTQLAQEGGGVQPAVLRAIAPHIVYHLGSVLYVFPVFASNATIVNNCI
jgi:hypothetical protein